MRKVYLSIKAFHEICHFSATYASNFIKREKWAESMGYLFCRRDGDRYLIEDAVGISRGGETYVTMTPDDLAKIEQLDADRPELFLGGWFHTHPGLSPFYSETDILNQLFYQAGNEDGLGLVFDHSMVSANFIGFKNFRVRDPQDPSTDYYDVSWTPLDWTEHGLIQALEPLGVSKSIVENLAYSLKLRASPPAGELPPFVAPNVKDDVQAQKLIDNIENSSETAALKHDYFQALIAKRVQLFLLRKYGDIEQRVDAMLTFLKWAITDQKVLAAEAVLDELDVIEDDGKLPEEYYNYYMGMRHLYRGKAFQAQLQYSNAIEVYQKAIPLFETEEIYDEECAEASMNIALCLEYQSEYVEAMKWAEKGQNYLTTAFNDMKEDPDDYDEEDFIQVEQKKKEISGLLIRLNAKNSAVSHGPTRIV